jgi:hypothetical protein
VLVGHGEDLYLHRRQPGREGARVVLDQDPEEALDRPNSARWIMIGRWRVLSAPVYSRPKSRGSWKSTWMVDSCHVRPMASRACTEILGP